MFLSLSQASMVVLTCCTVFSCASLHFPLRFAVFSVTLLAVYSCVLAWQGLFWGVGWDGVGWVGWGGVGGLITFLFINVLVH